MTSPPLHPSHERGGETSIFISAGEASGDLHGAEVAKELLKALPDLKLFGMGGDRMEEAGVELVMHSKRMSFMGFAEVIRHLPFIFRARTSILAEIARRRPKLVILIDYPGFHFSLLRNLARWSIGNRPKVLYYIAPQVWAWKPKRAAELARKTDGIAVIFPFEVELFEKLHANVRFVGHPLLDEAGEIPPRGEFLLSLRLQPDDRVVGLFPGSRKQEIKRHLPVLIETVKLLRRFHPDLKFILAESPSVPETLYEKFLKGTSGITCVRGRSHAVMAHANASTVKSGSSTIEAAYFGNPFVVFYKTSPLSFAIGKRVVKVPFIAMVNILAGKEVVKELIQDDATPENLMGALLPLLTVPDRMAQVRAGLKSVREQLGEPGAGKRVAEMALELMRS